MCLFRFVAIEAYNKIKKKKEDNFVPILLHLDLSLPARRSQSFFRLICATRSYVHLYFIMIRPNI